MAADDEEAVGCELQFFQNPRSFDLLGVVREHLRHRGARDEDSARGGAFREEIASGVIGIAEVDVGDVVDDAPVDLLGNVLVEAAIPASM